MRRANCLRTRADFERVRAGKRSLANPLLVLYTAPNELGYPRVGVTVGRRTAREFGKAVVRNRVRRRIREAARQRLSPGCPAYDLLFIARGPSAVADWPALSGAVDDLLRRAKISPPSDALTPTLSRRGRGPVHSSTRPLPDGEGATSERG